MAAVLEVILNGFAALVVLITPLISWFYWKNREILAEARKLPTVRLALPLLGHAYLLVHGFEETNIRFFQMIQTAASQAIKTIVFWMGPYPVFVITNPQDIQVVFNSTKSIDRALEPLFMKYALGNSFGIAPGSIWRNKRRHMKPLFHHINLETLTPKINELSRELNLSLLPHVSQGQLDLLKYMYTFAVNSTNSLVFGTDLNFSIGSVAFQKMYYIVHSIPEIVTMRLLKIWLWSEFLFCSLYKKDVDETNSIGKNYFKKALQLAEREEILKKAEFSYDNPEENVDKKEGRQITILDVYRVFQSKVPGYREEDLYHEMLAIYFGSSVTTEVTLSSCLLSLASKPELQDKLYEEIVSVVGTQDSDVTKENINVMPYLDQVLKETLRKFLILPLITRRIQSPLKLGSCTLPAGAIVCLPVFAMHLNPKYYPDPERFDPNRFNSENSADRSPHVFIPFGGGPRNCIGKDYGILVIKTLVVHLIRKYKLSTTTDIDNISYEGFPVPQLAGGYKVNLELRN